MIRIGPENIKFAFDAYYNAIRPKRSSDTTVFHLTVTFVFPRT